MDQKQIIMHYSVPPGNEDIEVMAREVLDTLPEELLEFCDEIEISVNDFVEEALEHELDLDDPYELVVLYRSGKEIAPGVERKVANEDDVLMLYRRPLLDLWCETEEDLSQVIRHAVIEELGRYFDFSDDEIEEMTARHYQGML